MTTSPTVEISGGIGSHVNKHAPGTMTVRPTPKADVGVVGAVESLLHPAMTARVAPE
jgi:hypothetical protein